MLDKRLVRIRYRELPDDILAEAWITEHGSVVICLNRGLSAAIRRNAVRHALRAAESNAETTEGPTHVSIWADPCEAVRDDPSVS